MRWRKLLLAAFVFAAVLELVLQIGAFVAATFTAKATAVAGPSVVCIGDSYTAGIGASSPETSYPAQLQALLHGSGHADVTVVNGGCPGKDSAFMIRRLPALLGPDTRVVCMLMAFNDTWSRPDRVDTATLGTAVAPTGGFELQWRTGRLLALLFGFGDNSWHRTSEELARQQAAAAPAAAPAANPPAAPFLAPDAGFALLEQLGVIAATDPPPEFAPLPPADVAQAIAAIERDVVADRMAPALAAAEALHAAHPDSAHALRTLAVAARSAGATAKFEAAMTELAGRAADGSDAAAVENQLIALLATGRTEGALAAAKKAVEHTKRSLPAWLILQEAAFLLGDFDAFRAAVPTTLRLAGRLLAPQSAAMARHYAQVVQDKQPRLAARLVAASGLLDGDRSLLRAGTNTVRPCVSLAEFEAAVGAADAAPAAVREALVGALREILGDDGSATPWMPTLRQHMLDIARICKDRGIRLVVLSYPFPHPALEEVQHQVATAIGATFVPVRERFDAELKTRPRDELFVRNGHCTDAGYGILAELAAAAVAPLL